MGIRLVIAVVCPFQGIGVTDARALLCASGTDFPGELGMAFVSKGKSFALLRLNLGPKAVLSAALLIAVNTALVVGAGYCALPRDCGSAALRDIDDTVRELG